MAAGDFSSPKRKDVRKADIEADADAAEKRLSKAISFRAISHQDRSGFEEPAGAVPGP